LRIDSLAPAGDLGHHRYQTPFSEQSTQAQALEAAIQFGKDIVDGKLEAPCLPH
jgi:hypothetical protein